MPKADIIDFYEAGFFTYHDKINLVFFNLSPFNLMQQGKEYFVFANKKPFQKEYQETLKYDVYTPASVEISWFETTMSFSPILDESPQKYAHVKNNEMNVYSEKQRKNIDKFKSEIIKKISDAK